MPCYEEDASPALALPSPKRSRFGFAQAGRLRLRIARRFAPGVKRTERECLWHSLRTLSLKGRGKQVCLAHNISIRAVPCTNPIRPYDRAPTIRARLQFAFK
jgi:hypothetical protein